MVSCSVAGCKTDDVLRLPNISLYKFPADEDMKRKWCARVGRKDFKPTSLSSVCSLHFADTCLSGTILRADAVPTKFFSDWNSALVAFKAKRRKDTKTDVEMLSDINKNISQLQKPSSFKHPLGNEKNNPLSEEDSPENVKLWVIINRQIQLINKLMSARSQDSSTVTESEDAKATNKELERKLDTYKYIVKCLQEKQTTLEEQIEILSAVESR